MGRGTVALDYTDRDASFEWYRKAKQRGVWDPESFDLEQDKADWETEFTDDELIETEEGADFEGKPTARDVTCDECGHGVAWYTIKQTGSADEPPTRFFKCTECGHRWRGYN